MGIAFCPVLLLASCTAERTVDTSFFAVCHMRKFAACAQPLVVQAYQAHLRISYRLHIIPWLTHSMAYKWYADRYVTHIYSTSHQGSTINCTAGGYRARSGWM